MKILQIGKFYPPYRGGMETHLQGLVTGLRHHVDVDVLVANQKCQTVEETIDGVPVCRLSSLGRIAATSVCPGMAERIRSTPADIVHIHWPNPAAVIAYLSSRHPGRLVITYHSDVIRQRFLSQLFAPILKKAMARTDAVIATSPDYIQASPILTRYRDRCHVLPFGIPDRLFEPPDQTRVNQLRSRFGGPIVLSVGRLVYYKGFEFLIRAMVNTPGVLLLVGEGPLRERLQAVINECRLSDRVFLLHGIDDEELRAYYAAADVFVLPSVIRSEAFGLAQVEAMAAGKPVLNTRLDSGVPYVSLHGVTGITVPPANTAALAEALRTLLADEALRRRYGQAGRERADTEFRASRMVERTLSLYQSIVQPYAAAV